MNIDGASFFSNKISSSLYQAPSLSNQVSNSTLFQFALGDLGPTQDHNALLFDTHSMWFNSFGVAAASSDYTSSSLTFPHFDPGLSLCSTQFPSSQAHQNQESEISKSHPRWPATTFANYGLMGWETPQTASQVAGGTDYHSTCTHHADNSKPFRPPFAPTQAFHHDLPVNNNHANRSHYRTPVGIQSTSTTAFTRPLNASPPGSKPYETWSSSAPFFRPNILTERFHQDGDAMWTTVMTSSQCAITRENETRPLSQNNAWLLPHDVYVPQCLERQTLDQNAQDARQWCKEYNSYGADPSPEYIRSLFECPSTSSSA